MENEVEARKTMEIAQKKLSKNDYVGAKKFVNKAQNLYPKLDGLKKVSIMIDIYISSIKNGKGEEADLYEIIGVDPLANGEALKKQYKKLALLLHPDKNKFLGAEEAFKLVSNAFLLLSDKSKRMVYDLKRKSKPVNHHHQKKKKKSWKKHKSPPKSREEPDSNNNRDRDSEEEDDPRSSDDREYRKAKEEEDWRSYGNWYDPKKEPRGYDPKKEPRGYDPKEEPRDYDPKDTFWTFCKTCNTYCEFGRANILNRTLFCPNCSQEIFSTEMFPEMEDGIPVFRFYTPYGRKKQSTRSDNSSSTSTSDSANQRVGKKTRGVEEIAAAAASGKPNLYS